MDARSRQGHSRGAASETLIFVYGTLRRGGSNHRFLSRARFVREARSAPEYRMVDLGGFPAVVAGGRDAIVGEVYAVDAGTLTLLDELEDAPDYFRRSSLRLDDGEEVVVYLLPPGQAAGFPHISSGDWSGVERA